MDTQLVLLFDVGNTNIKICLASREKLFSSMVLPSDHTETPDSIGLKILEICRFFNVQPHHLRAWVISSVVPPMDQMLSRAARKFFQCPVRFVPRDIPLGLENRYANPGEVGADRLVAGYAARRMFPARSMIVVDFGTATTFDCLRDNAYLGGLICPGILSSVQSLGSKTAKLPRISLELESDTIDFGTSTRQSLNQGVLFGFAAMMDGLCDRLKRRLEDPWTKVVATGGFAAKLAPITSCIDHLQPDLLMQGLRLAYFSQTDQPAP
jgi:type III pantothenate kinase